MLSNHAGKGQHTFVNYIKMITEALVELDDKSILKVWDINNIQIENMTFIPSAKVIKVILIK